MKKLIEKMNTVILRDFFCEECSLQFGKKLVFDLHLSLVHGKETKIKQEPNTCGITAEESETSVSNHKVDQSCKCDICSACFKTNYLLKKHISSVHEEEKPFECDICDTKFTAKQNRHIVAIHEGRKPFKCDNCGTCFTQKSNMTKHISSFHKYKNLSQM